MIYKFMDDMDLKVAEWGSCKFFQGEYEKYALSMLMQSEKGRQERASLYAEGIEKMASNVNIPTLFRDIFKGTYITYRDPNTLNMFLDEIDEFNYENSEVLGSTFEHLLSIMKSQGDAGQFRTPRDIIDMMVEIVQPKKNETVLDPSCGTAGFLISSYKHILENNKNKDGQDARSPDERIEMNKNCSGYDISPDMVRLARVNMYLNDFTNPKIYEYDTLTSLEKWDENFDVILANPPFTSPKGGIKPHSNFILGATRSEVLFVDYIFQHLNPKGRAGIIVQESFLKNPNSYQRACEYIVKNNFLYAVISLPSGVFHPYAEVGTAILLFDKTIAKKKDDILFL